MKKTIVLLSLLGLFVSCNPAEYDTSSNITGTVIDAGNQSPIYGASVSLSPSGKKTDTDGNGCFQFVKINAGQYDIIVQKNNYDTEYKSVTAIAGNTVNIVIPMINSN